MIRSIFLVFSVLSIPLTAQQLQESMARRYGAILRQAGTGDYNGAMVQLFQFVNEAPSFSQAYGRIASFAYYSHQVDRADSFFVAAMGIHTGNALYGRALIAKYRQQYLYAVELLFESIGHAPRSIHAYIALGEFLRTNKTIPLDQPIQRLETIIRGDAHNPAPLIGLATIYSRDARNKFGLPYALRALRLDSSIQVIYTYCYSKIYNEAYNVYPRDYSGVTQLLERTLPKICETEDQLLGSMHHLLGLVYHLRLNESVTYIHRCGEEYTRAFDIARMFGNQELMSSCLCSMGKFDAIVGDYPRALERYSKGARIGHDLGRWDLEAQNYQQAGFASYLLGNYRDAITFYKKAGDLESTMRNTFAFESYRKIADIYHELQDYPHALDYTGRAAGVLDSGTYQNGYPRIMNTRGEILISDQQPDSALATFESGIRISRSQQGQDHITGLLTLGAANAFSALGKEHAAVRAFYRAGILLDKYTDSKTSYLLGLARFHKKYHHIHAAIGVYRSLLSLYSDQTSIWDINYERLAAACEEQGELFASAGEVDSALAVYRAGITSIEKLRTTVQNSYQAAQILSRHINLYMNSAYLLAKRGKIDEASQIAEQSRARTLQDRLFEATIKLSSSIPGNLRLEQYTLDQQFQDLNARLSACISEGMGQANLQNLRDSIDLIELNREHIKGDMVRFGGGIAPTQFHLLGTEEIQKRIGDTDAVVSYICSKNGYGAFVITRTGLKYVDLPVSRDTIQRLAGSVSPTVVSGTGTGRTASARIRSSYNPYDAARLSAFIFSPLLPYLEGKKNLIIIPDDILHYVSFESLPFSATGISASTDFDRIEFLLYRYTIHYLPSTSAIGWDFSNRAKAEERLLAIGNPDIGKASETYRSSTTKSIQRGERQVIPDSAIVSLPFTADEVCAIGSIVEGSNQVLGKEATVDRFRSLASRYQILHIATHYFIDDKQPLFSRLVFAPVTSEHRVSYFQTFELYQMQLSADLTVLSACNTALGLLQRGEGLNGITQAFMTAGSPSLVVSLWNVDDQSTSILMKYFYTGLISGMTKAEALRKAKIQLIHDGYGDPMYWAGFILMGDNTPLSLVPIAYPAWLTAGCIVVALFILTILTIHRYRMSKRKDTV